MFTVSAGQTDSTRDAGLFGAAPSFGWAQNLANVTSYYAGNTPSYASLVTTDASGNVYVAGTMDGTKDFDNGPGTYNLTASGPATFVAKYSSAGALVWAKDFTGFWNAPGAIAVGADGSVYTAGAFAGTVDFDPGAGTASITSQGTQDAFVSKLDSTGALAWVKDVGGTLGAAGGNGIAVAADGSVGVTGQFNGTVHFGTLDLTAPTGQQDAYISKLDSAGNVVWAANIAASGGAANGIAVAVDADGSILAAGNFSGTADFGSGPGTLQLTSAGLEDTYIAKLDSAGNFVWVKGTSGTGYDDVYGIAVASDGSVYATGRFEDTCDFDPSVSDTSLTSAGLGDIYVVKLTSFGDFTWAKSIGGTGDDWGQGVAVGPDGSVYLAGEFQGTVDFDPGLGTSNLTSAGNEGTFVARLDSAGNFLWAGATGSNATDPLGRIDNLSQGITVAYDGSVYTTGQFEGTANLDPSGGTFNLTGTLAAGNNGFLAKFSAPVAGFVAPVVTLTAPAVTSSTTPSATMTATEAAPGVANGTTAYLDVDLNNDGAFTGGEIGYLTATVSGGTATFTPTSSLTDGTYHLRARVSDMAGVEGQSAVVTMVVAATPEITLTPPAAKEGLPFSNVLLAHFDTFGLGNYTATIDWGDGTTPTTVSTAASAAGYIIQHDPSDPGQGFDVFAGHTYVEELSGATFSVQVTDGTTTISKSTTFNVADQQLTNVVVVSGKVPTGAQRGVPLTAITGLATFTDPAGVGNETVADFTATINWGDGNTSPGSVVSLGGGNYQVDAPAYTYVHSGLLNISVTVKHDALPSVTSPALPITVASSLPIVVSTTPSIAGGSLGANMTTLAINFNMTVANANSAANYKLQCLGPDGLLGTADDLNVPIASATYVDAPTHTATLQLLRCVAGGRLSSDRVG